MVTQLSQLIFSKPKCPTSVGINPRTGNKSGNSTPLLARHVSRDSPSFWVITAIIH